MRKLLAVMLLAGGTMFGADWSGWDGTENAWREYRDWLYSAADSQDTAMYHAAYERLEPLNDMPFEERASALKEFGFTIEANEGKIRELADQLYLQVIEELMEEDPDFHGQLEGDPELAQAIYEEALRRLH